MDQGRSAMDGGPPPPATGSFALDLSRAGVTLYWLSSHAVWNAVEHVVLQDGLVAERMGQLRARIGGLPEPARVDVWLPEDQVTVRVLETGGAMPTEQMVAALFADLTGALEFDAEVCQGATAHTIAAIPRAVLEQTRDFLRPHGFVIDTCTVRDAPAGMDHAPVFPLDPPAAATRRAMPPRAGLAAAGAGLLLGGGLLVGLLLGMSGDRPPRAPLVAMDGLAGPAAAGGGSGQTPGGRTDAGGRAELAGDIRSADSMATFAAPENPLAVGRSRIDQPLPRTPALTEAVGPLPRTGVAPQHGGSPRLAPVAAQSPQAPAIYARPVQTEIAAPLTPGVADGALPPVARQWPRHAAALPAAWLNPVAGAGDAPDLSALRAMPQPAAMILDPVRDSPRAGAAPTAAPQTEPSSYVAMLPGELGAPAGAPVTTDFSGVRSRPASVPPLIMVSLAMPDATGDPAGTVPAPEAALPRPAAAPAQAGRPAPPAEFALSAPLGRPALTGPGDDPSAPAEDPTPVGPVFGQGRTLHQPAEIMALGAPSGPLPSAEVSGSLDWMPVRSVPERRPASPSRQAGESALDAVLSDILAGAPARTTTPPVAGAEHQPRAQIATDGGTRPDDAAQALAASAPAVQPFGPVMPRAADGHDEIAGLPGPVAGVQVGRPQIVQQVRPALDRPAPAPVMTLADGAAPPPEPFAPTAPGAESGADLPRAQVAPRGTIPPLPEIEFTALDRSLGGAESRPRGASGPAIAAPADAPDAVSVPLPAPPPSSEGPEVEVAVINARPDVVPPLRPRPQVIEARPDIVPPLRGAVEAGIELAALPDADAAPEAGDDAADPAVQVGPRPRPRPPGIEAAETARMAALAPSELALNRTDAPRRRPSDLTRVQPAPAPPAPGVAAPAPTPPAPSVAAPAPKRTAPELPTAASVARAATIKNALPFGRMTLIGVFGSTRSPHAILRMRSGDFVKVRNGDTVDGYQVSGMSGNAIRLRRGGRETLLVIPQ